MPDNSKSNSYSNLINQNSTYFVSTIDTASLRMLSPNTSMFNTGSTSRALNIAIVATGSTAETNDPKAKLKSICNYDNTGDLALQTAAY